MPESVFDQEKVKLKGMNEVDATFELASAFCDEAGIKSNISKDERLVI